MKRTALTLAVLLIGAGSLTACAEDSGDTCDVAIGPASQILTKGGRGGGKSSSKGPKTKSGGGSHHKRHVDSDEACDDD